MTKEQIIEMAMDCLGWKEAKCVSWYTQENRWLGGNSPRELMQRGETEKVVKFLQQRLKERIEDGEPVPSRR
jgi:hypothetical protein